MKEPYSSFSHYLSGRRTGLVIVAALAAGLLQAARAIR